LYIFGNLVNFPRFGILDQEKSGNPVLDHKWEYVTKKFALKLTLLFSFT
jgi:hypothetical protein